MNPRTKIILTVVGAFLVCLLFFVFMIKPRSSELAERKTQIEEAETETARLNRELAALRELKKNAPKVQAQLAEIREKVPQANEVPNFIFQVQQAANSSGVGFVQITPELPKSPPEGAALAQIRITIGAKGGYFAVQDFVRRLTRLDRAVRIDLLTIGGVEDEIEARERGRTDLQIVARIFFELPPGSVGTTTAGATTTPPPVTTTPPPATGTSPSPTTAP